MLRIPLSRSRDYRCRRGRPRVCASATRARARRHRLAMTPGICRAAGRRHVTSSLPLRSFMPPVYSGALYPLLCKEPLRQNEMHARLPFYRDIARCATRRYVE